MLVLKPASILDVGGRGRDDEIEIELSATGPADQRVGDVDSVAIQRAALAGDVEVASTLAEEHVRKARDLARLLPVITRIVPLR